MESENVQVTLKFINRINEHDVPGISKLVAKDRVFIDIQNDRVEGKGKITEGWAVYLENNPEYHIFIYRVFLVDRGIVLMGRTTGSHLRRPDSVEFHGEGVIWLSKAVDGKIALWQIYEDSQDVRDSLNLDRNYEFFPTEWIAATIAKHLDLLPAEARTKDVRTVRKYYSQLYRHAPPEIMLSIAQHLFFDEGYRFVPYELIYYHKGCVELLSPQDVISLGGGINDWSSTDIFAHFIAGPAWKKERISDEIIDQWIHSPIVWWRRAAVVSTIYLNGDVGRMLKYSEMLINDKEDMIIKALSWVLRETSKYDRQAVEEFLSNHDAHLAARIKREVRNKLDTGLKNP